MCNSFLICNTLKTYSAIMVPSRCHATTPRDAMPRDPTVKKMVDAPKGAWHCQVASFINFLSSFSALTADHYQNLVKTCFGGKLFCPWRLIFPYFTPKTPFLELDLMGNTPYSCTYFLFTMQLL